jgi:HEAT repeat protein
MLLLVPVLADRDSAVAQQAEQSLVARGYHPQAEKVLRPLLRSGEEVPKKHILNWLEKCGAQAREVGPVLVERLEDPQSEYAERATEVLMATGYHPEMLQVLRRCLRNEHQNRNLRALALCRHYGAEARELTTDILPLLNSSNPIVQEAAIQAVGAMPFNEKLEKNLRKLLSSPRAETRVSVFQTIQLMNVPFSRIQEMIEMGRADRDAWVRSVATDAMEAAHSKGAAPQ